MTTISDDLKFLEARISADSETLGLDRQVMLGHSAIDYTNYDLASDRQEKFKQALTENKIPIELAEKLKILDPESSEAIALKDSFQPIIDRLLVAIEQTDHAKKYFEKFNPEKHQVQLLFSADEHSNAGVLNFTNPAVIVINKGLLTGKDSVLTVDALAWILAHELCHKALELKLGQGQGSKGEEGLADALGLEITHHAGFDIRQSREYLKTTKVEPKTQDEKFKELIDEHPSYHVRISLLEAGLTALEKSIEKLSIEPTPIQNTHISSLARDLSFKPLREPSQFEQKLGSLLEGVHNPGSREILGAIAGAMKLADFNDYRSIKDIVKAVNGLNLVRASKEDLDIVDAIANQAIELVEGTYSNSIHEKPLGIDSGRLIYEGLSNALLGASTPKSLPLGRFKNLEKPFQEFIDANNKVEIFEKANALLKAFAAEPLVGSRFFNSVALPKFSLALKYDSTVTWQPHYAAIESLGSMKRDPVVRALISMGVNDTRLYNSMNLNCYLEVVKGELKKMPDIAGRTKQGEIIRVSDVEISRSGAIYNFGPVSSSISRELASLRASRLPDLIETLFANLDPHSASPKDISILHEASYLLKEIFNQNGDGPKYLLGLKNLDKNPVLFCELNSLSISRYPELQSRVATQAKTYLEGDHPEKREILRQLLSVEKDNKTNPFHYAIESRIRDLPQEQDSTVWESEELALINLPMAKLLLSLPNDIVSASEKVALLLQPNLSNQKGGVEICSKARLQVIRGILKEDFPEFVAPSNSFEGLFAKHAEMRANPTNKMSSTEQFSILEAEFRELALTPKKLPSAHDLLRLCEVEPDWVIAYDPALADRIRERYLKKLPELPVDGETAVKTWKVLHESALIPPRNIYSMLDKVISNAERNAESSEAEKIYCSILQGHRIVDPIVRQRCISSWGDAVRNNIGLDDGSEQFNQSLRHTISTIGRVDPALKEELLNMLGKRLNTQRAATQILDSSRPNISRQSLENSQMQGIGIEEVLNLTRREPDTRDCILKFLTSQLTQNTIQEFVSLFPEADSSSRNTFGAAVLSTAFDAELWERYQDAFKEEAAKQFHRNFWAAPFEVRTVIARELFLPAEETSPQEEEKIFKVALEQTFPSKVSYGRQAQEFVRSYIKNVPEYSKHLSIAALMVAAEKSNNSSVGVGYALASFLETMGPAETKAGQAAESHPATPSEIRSDLKRLKTMADEPTRWALWATIDESVPDEIKENIARVDEVLGCGSFYVVASVTMTDDSQKVIALLRKHALTRAENGFGLMSAMAVDLGHNHQAFHTLDELIDQAKELSKVESNPILSKEQIDIARNIYNGSSVTVDGYTFNFHVPSVDSVGQSFRLMEKVEGSHFSDLPQSDETKAIAKAIATFEISNIVKGLPFDDDRHGGNVKIEGNTIHHYDFGGMMLTPPTDEELGKFANVMLDTLFATQAQSEFVDNFFQQIKTLQEREGSVPTMIKRVQKALLSLDDYRKHFPKEEDVADVLISAIRDSHPILQANAMQRMSSVEGQQKLSGGLIAKLFMPPILIKRPN